MMTKSNRILGTREPPYYLNFRFGESTYGTSFQSCRILDDSVLDRGRELRWRGGGSAFGERDQRTADWPGH